MKPIRATLRAKLEFQVNIYLNAICLLYQQSKYPLPLYIPLKSRQGQISDQNYAAFVLQNVLVMAPS